MREPFAGRRLAGRIFLTVGILLLLVVAAGYALPLYQGELVRNRLRSGAPPPAAVSQPTETPTQAATASLTVSATAAPVQPTQVALAAPSATATLPAPTPTQQPTPTALPDPTSTPEPAGPPVRIMMPDLGIDVPVSPMAWTPIETAAGTCTEWQIPEHAAGHHINSAPLAAAGNIVISGHNNIYGKVFQNISFAWGSGTVKPVDAVTDSDDVLDGRPVELYAADGRRFLYRVTAFYRLHDTGITPEQRQANARFMQPTQTAQLTLITCWPPTSNTYRLVVIARPAS